MISRQTLLSYAVYLVIGLAVAAGLVVLSDPLERLFQPIPGGTHSSLFWVAIVASIVLWGLLLAVLHRLPNRAKKRLIVVITFTSGLFFVLQFFLPEKSAIFFWRPAHGNPFTPLLQPFLFALSVMGGFTFFLATFNLSRIHARQLARLRSGWYNSLAFFIAFIAMSVFSLWNYYTKGADPTAARWHGWLFNSMYVPLNSTLFSLTAFYMATASFRAFRIRSAEAALMMAAAVIVMVGQVPVGQWLTSGLPHHGVLSIFRTEIAANWLLEVVNSAALRAVLFGLLVGGLAMSLRLWLNLERGAFFDQEL